MSKKVFDAVETSNRIFELTAREGWKDSALADALGVSAQAVYKWRKGKCVPSIDTLYDISQLFRVKLDELVGSQEIADNYNKDYDF